MRLLKKWWLAIAGAALVVVVTVAALVVAAWKYLPELKGAAPLGKKIGVVDIKGTIRSSEDTIAVIHRYRDDPTVAAVVLYIDSPGGAVAPTQEIYDELLLLKKKNKKVYAYVSNVGASGAYYIACAADKIYASPGSLVGSIGVIMTFTNMEGLLGKIGISARTIKAGRYKDIGSPFRPMSPEEEAMLGETLDDVHQMFIDAVVVGRRGAVTRHLKVAGETEVTKYAVRRYVTRYADGRIFSGRQAYRLGFVDEMGNFQRCIRDLARDLGIKGKPTVIRVKPKEKTLWSLASSAARRIMNAEPGTERAIEIKYAWY